MRAYLERRVQRFSLLSIGRAVKWVDGTREEWHVIQGRVGLANKQADARAGGPMANVRRRYAGV